MADNKINVGGRLHSIATGNVLAGADEILDDSKNKKQSDINTETYNLVNEVNAKLDSLSPEQQTALAVAAKANKNEANLGYYVCETEANVAAKVVANATGYILSTGGSIKIKMNNTNTADNATLNINSTGANPLYYDGERASTTNTWEAGEIVEVYYDGTNFYANNVEGGGKFTTGEKVKNVGIDAEPTAGSDNLVKSDGVYSGIRSIVDSYSISSNIDLELSDEDRNVLVRFSNGHIKTKNFDSSKDASEEKRGLMSSADKAKLNTVEEGAEVNDINTSDQSLFDLDVTDEDRNVLVRFSNGHIKTKNFDSNAVALIHNLSYKRRTFWQQAVDTTNYLTTCYDDVNINSYETITYYNDNALLYLPASYKKDGEPTKLIIYCKHGDSKIEPDSDDILSSNNLGKIFRFMLHLGYGILAADGTPNEWASQLELLERPCGSYVAVESTIRAFDYVKNHYNIDADNVFIFGYSQGGLYAQNVIDNSNIPIAAAAQVSPVVSMRYQQWDNIGNVTPTFQWTYPSRYNIAKIFNFPSFTTDEELSQLEYDYNKTVGYDPWLRNVDNMYTGFTQGTPYGSNLWGLPSGTSIDDITMRKHIKCPLKIWASKNDSVISSDVWKVFVKAIKNSGQIADLQLYSTGAHIPIYSQNQVLGTFTENEDICNLYPIALDIASWYFRFGGYPINYQV